MKRNCDSQDKKWHIKLPKTKDRKSELAVKNKGLQFDANIWQVLL